MSDKPVRLIEATTSAVTAEYYFEIEHIGATIVRSGDLAANTIPIVFVGADGTESDAYKDGVLLELTETDPAQPITSACFLRIKKPVTTNSVAVDLHGIKQ